ncbi:MAG: hypothetical protein A2Y25_07695 [Candidatus Melainabacteria bacterium GWF2_37_15]|nr:MAG: hypothetical protein A2Y25_07695 [Candidatus Melainabacteria bacterium GWF2_37_15]
MKNHKFQVILITVLVILFIFMAFKDNAASPVISDNKDAVVVFYQPGCHACQQQEQYIEEVLKNKYPDVTFEYHDVTVQAEYDLLQVYVQKHGLNVTQLATPVTFSGENYLIGFENGQQLERLIENKYPPQAQRTSPKYVDTWFGRVNVLEKSLPVLAITLGLVDGFNPCAMWVLVYMISLIAGLADKRKIWLIVGTFVFASTVLYYLFMSALLSVFLYIGFLRILQLIIGIFALYVGIINLRNWNNAVCKVSNTESSQKTKGRVKRLVEAKISVLTVLGIIGLAFAVNSMEFVCSAALPAIFTGVLAQAKLSTFAYHSYILLYVFFFMLDDLIIFSVAAFAVNYYAGERFIGPLKLIGGVVIFILGVIMVFFPGFLR